MKGATYRQVLDEVQPHYEVAGLIVAAIAAGISAYSASEAKKRANRAKRGGMNADQLAKGGMDASVPTAHRFAGGAERGGGGANLGSARLGDFLGKAGTGASSAATPKEQGFSLGLKKLGDETTPPPVSMEQSNGMKIDAQEAMPITKIEDQPQVQQQQGGVDTAGQASGYAQTAMQLYEMYAQMQKGPDPGKAAPVGPMNLQPTASRFGQRTI